MPSPVRKAALVASLAATTLSPLVPLLAVGRILRVRVDGAVNIQKAGSGAQPEPATASAADRSVHFATEAEVLGEDVKEGVHFEPGFRNADDAAFEKLLKGVLDREERKKNGHRVSSETAEEGSLMSECASEHAEVLRRKVEDLLERYDATAKEPLRSATKTVETLYRSTDPIEVEMHLAYGESLRLKLEQVERSVCYTKHGKWRFYALQKNDLVVTNIVGGPERVVGGSDFFLDKTEGFFPAEHEGSANVLKAFDPMGRSISVARGSVLRRIVPESWGGLLSQWWNESNGVDMLLADERSWSALRKGRAQEFEVKGPATLVFSDAWQTTTVPGTVHAFPQGGCGIAWHASREDRREFREPFEEFLRQTAPTSGDVVQGKTRVDASADGDNSSEFFREGCADRGNKLLPCVVASQLPCVVASQPTGEMTTCRRRVNLARSADESAGAVAGGVVAPAVDDGKVSSLERRGEVKGNHVVPRGAGARFLRTEREEKGNHAARNGAVAAAAFPCPHGCPLM